MKTIERSFQRFHEAHPEVYEHLVRLCWQARAAGRRKIGIGMLFEVIRWHYIIEGLPDPEEEFKLNNNYRSRYARMIMEKEEGLEDIFNVRELQTA